MFLGYWTVNCDFTRMLIDQEIVRVGVDIGRIAALSFVLCENRTELFYVFMSTHIIPLRYHGPTALYPPNHVEKLARRSGVALRRSSEHRAKYGLNRRNLRGLVAFTNRDRTICFGQSHRAQAVYGSTTQRITSRLYGLFFGPPFRIT